MIACLSIKVIPRCRRCGWGRGVKLSSSAAVWPMAELIVGKYLMLMDTRRWLSVLVTLSSTAGVVAISPGPPRTRFGSASGVTQAGAVRRSSTPTAAPHGPRAVSVLAR